MYSGVNPSLHGGLVDGGVGLGDEKPHHRLVALPIAAAVHSAVSPF